MRNELQTPYYLPLEGVATTVGMHTEARNFLYLSLSFPLVMQFSVGIVQNIRKRTNEKQKINSRRRGGEENVKKKRRRGKRRWREGSRGVGQRRSTNRMKY